MTLSRETLPITVMLYESSGSKLDIKMMIGQKQFISFGLGTEHKARIWRENDLWQRKDVRRSEARIPKATVVAG